MAYQSCKITHHQRFSMIGIIAVLLVTVAGCTAGSSDAPPVATATSAPSTTPAPTPAPTGPVTISGTPSTTIQATMNYSFTPTTTNPQNASLSFQASGLPAWLKLNSTTGALSGIPTVVGTTSPITITVSGGGSSASLPAFTIQVMSPPNLPPVISGTAPTSIISGQAYSFTPMSSDPDSGPSPLSFSISGNPTWMSINPTTGLVSGTPVSAASYSRITITVSDGQLTASLLFNLTVQSAANATATLSWTPPTQNTDGSPLPFSSITGFTVYYGSAANQLSKSVPNIAPSATSYTVVGLGSGTTYFAMTTTASGVESDFSSVVSKVIP